MRILVTRPQPGAEQTAARLAQLGHEPVLLPLTRIEGLSVAETGAEFDAGVASSVNSIRHAPRWLLAALQGKPVHVVGKATAAAVRASGLRVGEIAEGAAGLAEQLAGSRPGTRFAYLCGRVRLPLFQERMKAAGQDVLPFEVYDTLPIPCLPVEAASRIGSPVDAVLLYSALAARAWLTLVSEPALARMMAQAWALCLSRRIAAELAGWPRVQAAERADEEALLELVQQNAQA